MGRWSFGRTVTLITLVVLLGIVLWRIMSGVRGRDTISYTGLATEYLAPGRVQSIRVIGDRLEATLKASDRDEASRRKLVYLGSMGITPALVESWAERGINVEFRPSSSAWRTLLNAVPYLAILVIVLLLFRQAQNGPRGLFSFGKSRARELTEDVPTITFAEVAGVEEAKQELQEIVEFLREPDKFQRLGGKIPRGVLVVGPPGTGKTYLARAVAGEAGVPFFSISGSDFVEMFVGVGASRVRDLFGQAKTKAPCIVFIDEIDAVGRQRGAGIGGGHDEREQTLNQLLVEMDGFNSASTVILIAATNRPDVLDPALLRPGRFDRQVVIDMPDVRGREGILRIHSRNVPLASDVDLGELARGTPGLSGADLRNLVNEAALLGARHGRREVGMHEFEMAKEKVMWGVERRSLVMTEEERHVTAVHEAGHALVTLLTPGTDPVHKVMIVPRGRALGLTSYLPDGERHTVSRTWCNAKLVSILGGRAAEDLLTGEITNGAANDLEIATALARRMVCEWGMSPRLGPVMLSGKDSEVFIGRDLVQARVLSEQTLQSIDEEVRRLIDEALQQARDLLQDDRDTLEAVAHELLVREVLDRAQIERIIKSHGGAFAAKATVESSVDVPAGPTIVEHPAASPQAKPDRERQSSERSRRRPPPQRPTEPLKTETSPARTPVAPHDEPLPAPSVEEKEAGPKEPEKAAVSEIPMRFGRKPKMVKRFGLPASEAPQSGIPVSSVLRQDVIVYGRPLRVVDDADSAGKPGVEGQSETGNQGGGTAPDGPVDGEPPVLSEPVAASDPSDAAEQGDSGPLSDRTPVDPGQEQVEASPDVQVGVPPIERGEPDGTSDQESVVQTEPPPEVPTGTSSGDR